MSVLHPGTVTAVPVSRRVPTARLVTRAPQEPPTLTPRVVSSSDTVAVAAPITVLTPRPGTDLHSEGPLPVSGVTTYIQTSPASVWHWKHGLGRRPDVTVFVDDELVETDVDPTPTDVFVYWPTPMTGQIQLR